MNYDEIKSLALSYADREDDEVTNRMDDFLRMIEPRVNRAFTVLKMSVRAALNTVGDQAYYGLPADFNGIRDIEIYNAETPNRRRTLHYKNPEQMNALTFDTDTDCVYYTIIANQFQIYPVQDVGFVLEIVYFQNLIPLSTTFPNNWVSEYAPDAYVNGLLTEISAFVKDKEAAMLWNGRFKAVLAEIESQDDNNRWSGTPMEITYG